MANISDQIQQIQIIPKTLEQYSQEERDNFPNIFEWYVPVLLMPMITAYVHFGRYFN